MRRWKLCLAAFFFSACFLPVAAAAAAGLTLVRDGAPAAAIILPAAPEEAEREAAAELVEHLELMSGAALPVVAGGPAPAGLAPLFIGAAAAERLEALIREKGDDPWSFALVVSERAAHLRGLSPEGTRTAASELLEQLGVRWFLPGETGRVVPEQPTVVLAAGETVQVPAYSYRRGPGRGDHHATWNRRLRLGGVGGRYGAHGIRPFRGNAARFFESNPEYFALIDGQRRRRQLCLTNSTDDVARNEVLAHVVEYYRDFLRRNPATKVLNMGPDDGGGYCQCDHCRALDPPPYVTTPMRTPHPSYTDRYVWFFNHLTAALADEFPGVRVGFYAYGAHLVPPVNVEPRDNIAVSVAPIHVCRIHGPNNPACPESSFPRRLIEAWRPYAGDYIADRGYLFNLACPGFPFSMVHRVREEIPLFRELGVRIWAADPSTAWATHNPSMYIAAKLLWDHTADVDALLADFYGKYYGPAAVPMAAYHRLMDEAIRDADYHTGSSWDIPHIYPAALRRAARGHLARAVRQAGRDGIYVTRVAITARGLDFLDAFCELMERRHGFDFAGEKEALRRLESIRDGLLEDYEFPMLNSRHAQRLLDRFIRRMTMANYETVRHGGEIVARFDHQWEFQLDPESWGHHLGLHEPAARGGNWGTIRSDTSWSNQGLRYYFGQTWYRQAVTVPARFRGRRVHLWFAGVDNTAEAWVNGQFVGANHDGAAFDLDAFGSAFRAFEFDATAAINFGGENVVTVRHVRPGTNELGTGGIIGPVMFYVPGEAGGQ